MPYFRELEEIKSNYKHSIRLSLIDFSFGVKRTSGLTEFILKTYGNCSLRTILEKASGEKLDKYYLLQENNKDV